MTEPRGKYWVQPNGIYRTPLVYDTPRNQNPNHAREAIWHLSKLLTAEFYSAAIDGWREDGRYDKGVAELKPFWGVPHGVELDLVKGMDGEHQEGVLTISVDSHDPRHIEMYGADGIRFHMVDDNDKFNFQQIIQYAGDRYKIFSVLPYSEGGDEDLDVNGIVYVLKAKFYRHDKHERHASCATETIVSEPL